MMGASLEAAWGNFSALSLWARTEKFKDDVAPLALHLLFPPVEYVAVSPTHFHYITQHSRVAYIPAAASGRYWVNQWAGAGAGVFQGR